ncbi:MAG: protein-disulfide reductase DsbD family protein [Terrimicrobiaceae bacterium]|nr:protein-disulfide reductase DsbD family protein [Terrimicrobiaceae bacterium]
MKSRAALLASMLLLIVSGGAMAQTYEGRTLVEPRLIADTTAIVPGQPFRVGLVLKMAPKWHTYWEYAGDAGIPTQIKWQLPPGFAVGPIEWPLPEAILEPGDIQVYAYGGEVMLVQTIRPPASLAVGESVELKADASWLVCAELCIPGKAALSLSLPVASSAEPANADAFARTVRSVPSMDAPPFAISWKRAGDTLTGSFPAPEGTTAVDFFPLPAQDQEVGHPKIQKADGGYLIRISAKGDLRGVLAIRDAAGERGWYVVAAPSSAGAMPASTGLPTLWAALLSGLLGGLILNLMPCVLPVISLKIFGFVRQAGQSRRSIALHGLAFAAGIFAWFLGLGVVIVAIKASGAQATWAFQFQNPWFNLAIATLVFVFALNLFGVFELTLPGRATTALSEAGGREGYGGSFFQGVFATLLATPCTGPFLGSSLGFAFSQPAPVTLLLFGSIATGMALPYLALSAQPGWVRFLPKPGAWMERLKQFMGFPLLAALLWLLYIIGAQRGPRAIIWAAAFLLTLGVALWLYGLVAAPHVKMRSRLAGIVIALALALGGGWLFLGQLFAQERIALPTATSGDAADGIPWQPFSKAAVDKLLAEGKPVFIDFTADWCLTCKFNERTSINVPAVRKKMAELGIVPVRADWTNANPEITAALQRFDRVGVPFYVLYPAGKPDAPIPLPELLTESLVLETLSKAR